MSLSRVPGAPGAAPYVVVDLETTGLEPERDRIVECALLTLDSCGRVLDEWSSLVAIGASGPIGAAHLHGIGPAALRDAPGFGELIGALRARLRGRVAIGHVLAFDIAFLTAECARAAYALPEIGASGVCTRDLAREVIPGDSHSLHACCEHLGVALRGAHTALGDARATAGIFARLLRAGHIDARAQHERAQRLVWAQAPKSSRPARARVPGHHEALPLAVR